MNHVWISENQRRQFHKKSDSPIFWIPACAGMTIRQLTSDRYNSRHTRAGGYKATPRHVRLRQGYAPRQDAAAIDLESGKGRVCGGLRSGLLVLEESRQRRVDRQTPFS
jgi:hypothetical protein